MDLKASAPRIEFIISKKKGLLSLQVYIGLLVLSGNFVFLYFLGNSFSQGVVPWVFGLLFGFVLQRSRFCFAAAFRDIFLLRNTILTRAVLLGIVVASAGFLILEYLSFGEELLFTAAKVRPVGVFTIVGALLFGFGMVIAGGCASGMLMRMGEGYLMQWVCMGGFLVGSAFGAWQLGWWMERFILKSQAVFLPHLLGWPAAIGVHFTLLFALFLGALIYEKGLSGIPLLLRRKNSSGKKSRGHILSCLGAKKWEKIYLFIFKKPWPYYAGGVVLGLLNVMLLALWGSPWSLTSGIAYFAGWLSALAGFSPQKWAFFQTVEFLEGNYVYFLQEIDYFKFPLVYHFWAIVMGSFLAALFAGEFRLRMWRSGRYVAAALLGGFLMGYGSRLALGCNIGAFFSAVPSLSLHGWLFGFFTLIGSFLGGKALLKYFI